MRTWAGRTVGLLGIGVALYGAVLLGGSLSSPSPEEISQTVVREPATELQPGGHGSPVGKMTMRVIIEDGGWGAGILFLGAGLLLAGVGFWPRGKIGAVNTD